MNVDLLNVIKNKVIGIQEQHGRDFIGDGSEEFCPYDWSGGNFDDCFYHGQLQGTYDTCDMILNDIEDLIRSCNSYKEKAKGNEYTHVLTIDELPAHGFGKSLYDKEGSK